VVQLTGDDGLLTALVRGVRQTGLAVLEELVAWQERRSTRFQQPITSRPVTEKTGYSGTAGQSQRS
jgi:hypothetical protein